MRQRSINCQNLHEKAKDEKAAAENKVSNELCQRKSCDLDGNRISNLKYMSEQMYCATCNIPLLIHNIEGDITNGLGTVFKVRCHECLSLITVNSSLVYNSPVTGKPIFAVNTKAALGINFNYLFLCNLSILKKKIILHRSNSHWFGQTGVDKLASIMDLPAVNSNLFKSHERIVGPIIEKVAKDSCAQATVDEKTLTLECLDELKKLL